MRTLPLCWSRRKARNNLESRALHPCSNGGEARLQKDIQCITSIYRFSSEELWRVDPQQARFLSRADLRMCPLPLGCSCRRRTLFSLPTGVPCSKGQGGAGLQGSTAHDEVGNRIFSKAISKALALYATSACTTATETCRLLLSMMKTCCSLGLLHDTFQ